MRHLEMPTLLVEAAERQGRSGWLADVPALVEDLERRWGVRAEAPYQPGGQTAWVAPAGAGLVMKVAWSHPEAVHEADGLAVWAGNGTVRLHARTELPDTIGLLLERCEPGTPLAAQPELDQDEVIAGLLRRLWQTPRDGPFRPLQAMADEWADEYEAKATSVTVGVLDAGLVRQGLGLFRTLPATALREVLLCTDLHARNVLAAEREPWLVIDPKPHVGDPTYDVLQHMLNCTERLQRDPLAFARRMAELVDLDPDRLRLWLFARCVQESLDGPLLADVARRVAID